MSLKFEHIAPSKNPFEYKRPQQEQILIQEQINNLLSSGVITKSHNKEGYFSSVFTRPKSDGRSRVILNLKKLNPYFEKQKFKMATLKDVLNLISPNCYMASLDIENAYFSVPINESHKKYLKFQFLGQFYEFQVLPNGYSDAMRLFTKLLKAPLSALRKMGFSCIIYVDDSLLKGDTFEECLHNIAATEKLLKDLGFSINYVKSILQPTQIIIFLGNEINSKDMTLQLTSKKKQKIINKALLILKNNNPSIRQVASLLGSLTSSFEAVPFGRLNYRYLEMDKLKSLRVQRGNFDKLCHISPAGKTNILWWIHNLPSAIRSLLPQPRIDYTIFSDASMTGWGAHDHENSINDLWRFSTRDIHINELEMRAIKLALSHFLPIHNSKHVRIYTDNTTAMAYINKMGGTKSKKCNELACEIWDIAKKQGCHMSAAHIAGEHNVLADYKSRQYEDSAEWSIDQKMFNFIVSKFGFPSIDLFSSNENHKSPRYVSWLKDPNSTFIDAFSIYWDNEFLFIFPPFSLLPKVLRKAQEELTKGIIIAPIWSSQSWFVTLLELAIANPISFSSSFLSLPNSGKAHPMGKKLRLMAVLCSTRYSRSRVNYQSTPSSMETIHTCQV